MTYGLRQNRYLSLFACFFLVVVDVQSLSASVVVRITTNSLSNNSLNCLALHLSIFIAFQARTLKYIQLSNEAVKCLHCMLAPPFPPLGTAALTVAVAVASTLTVCTATIRIQMQRRKNKYWFCWMTKHRYKASNSNMAIVVTLKMHFRITNTHAIAVGGIDSTTMHAIGTTLTPQLIHRKWTTIIMKWRTLQKQWTMKLVGSNCAFYWLARRK